MRGPWYAPRHAVPRPARLVEGDARPVRRPAAPAPPGQDRGPDLRLPRPRPPGARQDVRATPARVSQDRVRGGGRRRPGGQEAAEGRGGVGEGRVDARRVLPDSMRAAWCRRTGNCPPGRAGRPRSRIPCRLVGPDHVARHSPLLAVSLALKLMRELQDRMEPRAGARQSGPTSWIWTTCTRPSSRRMMASASCFAAMFGVGVGRRSRPPA